ncbi:hypothetical protein [Yersinia phage vB_Yru_GN1]|uniref:Uncharacterized protein n=1 Tax=Yersinia phage vB_Yru_GN1 TaxID=3074381 RepID=A0AA86J560_9CAUD|nr:hypothetical protein [Yersinia phage vB_Yru_GN1]
MSRISQVLNKFESSDFNPNVAKFFPSTLENKLINIKEDYTGKQKELGSWISNLVKSHNMAFQSTFMTDERYQRKDGYDKLFVDISKYLFKNGETKNGALLKKVSKPQMKKLNFPDKGEEQYQYYAAYGKLKDGTHALVVYNVTNDFPSEIYSSSQVLDRQKVL